MFETIFSCYISFMSVGVVMTLLYHLLSELQGVSWHCLIWPLGKVQRFLDSYLALFCAQIDGLSFRLKLEKEHSRTPNLCSCNCNRHRILSQLWPIPVEDSLIHMRFFEQILNEIFQRTALKNQKWPTEGVVFKSRRPRTHLALPLSGFVSVGNLL